ALRAGHDSLQRSSVAARRRRGCDFSGPAPRRRENLHGARRSRSPTPDHRVAGGGPPSRPYPCLVTTPPPRRCRSRAAERARQAAQAAQGAHGAATPRCGRAPARRGGTGGSPAPGTTARPGARTPPRRRRGRTAGRWRRRRRSGRRCTCSPAR
ncbi:unnamed protein product, partial [Prorocentrum cordatum]